MELHGICRKGFLQSAGAILAAMDQTENCHLQHMTNGRHRLPMLRRGSAGLDPGTKPTWISRRPAPGCRSGRRTRYLFVFKDAKGMETFIESGWEAGGEVGAGVAALADTNFWKDKDLN